MRSPHDVSSFLRPTRSEFDRFQELTKRLVRVPKEEIKREEEREKRATPR
jgi:hypothetical protein